MGHCSVPIDSGGAPLGSVPIIGNRFIAIEGRLRDVIAALSNVTYVPDPNFNTDLPFNEDFIHVSIDDQAPPPGRATHLRVLVAPPPDPVTLPAPLLRTLAAFRRASSLGSAARTTPNLHLRI